MPRLRERFVIDENGEKTEVLLSVEDYRRLLEDLHDMAVVAERRGEQTLTLEEVRKRLKEDDLL